MADKEVNITFETLFEILRTERNREELQPLPATFNEDLKIYLDEKKHVAASMPAHRDQLENIERMLRELYERREQKILNLAMLQSRSNSTVDLTALLQEEKNLLYAVQKLLEDHKSNVFSSLNHEQLPVEPKPAETSEEPMPETKPVEPSVPKPKVAPSEPVVEPHVKPAEPSAAEPQVQPSEPPKQESRTMKVKFKNPVPKFVDRALKAYGPYEEDDIAELPVEIAQILLKKGRASHL